MSQGSENYHLYFCKVKQAHLRQVLWCIAKVADDYGYCWPSQAHIAQFCNVDERTVRRNIKKLVELGELKIAEIGTGRTCTTYVMPIYIPNVGVFFDGTPQDRGRTSDVLPKRLIKNVRPGWTSHVRSGRTPNVHRNTIEQHITKETPIVPLYKKTSENPNFEKIPSPHSQVAAIAATLDAPTSPPTASTLGLGGADAPLIDAAGGGKELQGDITASAVMSEQPVIEMDAGSSRSKQSPEQLPNPSTNNPIAGAHNGKVATRDENPSLEAIKARIGAYFNRTPNSSWTVMEQRHLDRLMPIPGENFEVLDFLFASKTNYDFRPEHLLWLLKNWGYVIDQARHELRKSCHRRAKVVPEWALRYAEFVDEFNAMLNCKCSPKERLICANCFFRLPDSVQVDFVARLNSEELKFLTTIKEEYREWQTTKKHTPSCVS
jgi:hypothetical protein